MLQTAEPERRVVDDGRLMRSIDDGCCSDVVASDPPFTPQYGSKRVGVRPCLDLDRQLDGLDIVTKVAAERWDGSRITDVQCCESNLVVIS